MCGSLPTLRPLVNWVRPKTYQTQATPQLADDTIGGGRRKKWGSRTDHFARLHGLGSLGNDSYAMNDLETLVEGRSASPDKVKGVPGANTTAGHS